MTIFILSLRLLEVNNFAWAWRASAYRINAGSQKSAFSRIINSAEISMLMLKFIINLVNSFPFM